MLATQTPVPAEMDAQQIVGAHDPLLRGSAAGREGRSSGPVALRDANRLAARPAMASMTGFVFLACFAFYGSLAGRLLADPDTLIHVAVGRSIAAHHAVPWTDTFSHTFAGAPWIAKEWLSQILFAGADALAGWAGVALLAAAAAATEMLRCVSSIYRATDDADGRQRAALATVAEALGATSAGALAAARVLVWGGGGGGDGGDGEGGERDGKKKEDEAAAASAKRRPLRRRKKRGLLFRGSLWHALLTPPALAAAVSVAVALCVTLR